MTLTNSHILRNTLLGGVAGMALIAAVPAAAQTTTSPATPSASDGATNATATTPTASSQANSSATNQTAANSGDIIVTARKRTERLQDVPLAITALSGADLQAAGVQDLRDITFQTPGLTFTTGAGGNYFSKPIIRGQSDIGAGIDNNVPVFFDGIYISNTSSIDFGLIDLARVEVIKGPVSATYGRSAYAGAINYVSNKPTDHITGQLQATGGNDGKYAFSGRISGPIFGDILKGGISGSYDHFDGTYHDSVTNQDRGGYVKRDFLVNLDFTPDEHIEIRPVLYYGNDRFTGDATVFGPANCGVSPGLGSYSASFCGNFPTSAAVTYGPYASDGGQYGGTGNTRKVLLTSLQASYTADWGTITSLTGFSHYRTREYNEFDDQRYGTPTNYYALPAGATVGSYPTGANVATFGTTPAGQVLTPLHFGYTNRNNDFSEELRYSTPQQNWIRGSVGGYYARTKIDQILNLARGTCSVPAGYYIVDYFAVPCGQTFSGQQTAFSEKNIIKAAFGSIEADIVHNLTLSTELRYSWTTDDYTDVQAIFTPFPTRGYSTSTASSLYPLGNITFNKTSRSLTSRSALTYKPSNMLTLYVSAANGEKSGGFNNNTTYPSYDPETNWTYEAGFKSQLFDRKVSLEADIFYIDAKNYQISGPPPNAALPGGFINTNFGGLHTFGFEANTSIAVTHWARLSAGIGYADPKFKSGAYDFGDVALCRAVPSCAGRVVTVGPNPAVSLKGLRPPFESNFTFNTALDLRYPIAEEYTGVFRLDYRHESTKFYQYPIDLGSYGPVNLVNIRVGVERGPLAFMAFVRNLTKDKTPTTVQDAAVTGATGFQAGYFPVAVLPDNRTFGVTATFKFGS